MGAVVVGVAMVAMVVMTMAMKRMVMMTMAIMKMAMVAMAMMHRTTDGGDESTLSRPAAAHGRFRRLLQTDGEGNVYHTRWAPRRFAHAGAKDLKHNRRLGNRPKAPWAGWE